MIFKLFAYCINFDFEYGQQGGTVVSGLVYVPLKRDLKQKYLGCPGAGD